MTIKELRSLLEHYSKFSDENLPVKFVSNESGGFWPRGRGAMGVFTEEQIGLVQQGMSSPHRLQISLMSERS